MSTAEQAIISLVIPYCQHRFDFGPSTVSAMAAVMGFGTFFSEAWLFDFALARIGPQRLLIVRSATAELTIVVHTNKKSRLQLGGGGVCKRVYTIVGSPILRRCGVPSWPQVALLFSATHITLYAIAWSGWVAFAAIFLGPGAFVAPLAVGYMVSQSASPHQQGVRSLLCQRLVCLVLCVVMPARIMPHAFMCDVHCAGHARRHPGRACAHQRAWTSGVRHSLERHCLLGKAASHVAGLCIPCGDSVRAGGRRHSSEASALRAACC